MINGFRHAIEEQSYADAAREEHEEPGDIVVLGDVAIFAQFDLRILGEIEPNEEHRPYVLGPDI